MYFLGCIFCTFRSVFFNEFLVIYERCTIFYRIMHFILNKKRHNIYIINEIDNKHLIAQNFNAKKCIYKKFDLKYILKNM